MPFDLATAQPVAPAAPAGKFDLSTAVPVAPAQPAGEPMSDSVKKMLDNPMEASNTLDNVIDGAKQQSLAERAIRNADGVPNLHGVFLPTAAYEGVRGTEFHSNILGRATFVLDVHEDERMWILPVHVRYNSRKVRNFSGVVLRIEGVVCRRRHPGQDQTDHKERTKQGKAHNDCLL